MIEVTGTTVEEVLTKVDQLIHERHLKDLYITGQSEAMKEMPDGLYRIWVYACSYTPVVAL